MNRLRLVFFAAVLAGLAAPGSSGAFTVSGTAGGRLVAPGMSAPKAVPDGAGGAIVAMRDPSTSTARVNRYSPGAGALWDQGISYEDSDGVQIEPDGAGGAILGVQKHAEAGLTVARILSSGATTWQAHFPDGVLASGGDGGAWVVSQSGDLYADGITDAGEPRPRVQISFPPDASSLPAATGDGSGGAYLAWRSAKTETQFGITLQHLSPDGTLWSRAADVAGSSESTIAPSVAPDGRGGVLVSWYAAGLLWVADYDAAGAPAWDSTLTFDTGGSRVASARGDERGTYVVWAKTLRAAPLTVEQLSVSFAGLNGALWWTRNVAAVDGGVLDLETSLAGGAVALGWQSASLPVIGSAIDSDLSVARVTADGAPTYDPAHQALATSLGPEAFGSVVDAGGGSVVAVFTQSPCLQTGASGVALQRIAPDGARSFGADGSCP